MMIQVRPVIQCCFPDYRVSSVIQRYASLHLQNTAISIPNYIVHLDRHSGQKMPAIIQEKMESFFQTDFSDVQIHIGSQAPAIGALAFTTGPHIYFAPGQYNPNVYSGHQLLGHELTHVVQQRAGRVRNPFNTGLAVVQDPHLENEAQQMGYRAAQYIIQRKYFSISHDLKQSVSVPENGIQLKRDPNGRPASYQIPDIAQLVARRNKASDTSRRVSWRPNQDIRFSASELKKSIVKNIENSFGSLQLGNYEMNGSQKATTQCRGNSYSTSMQMHSEMRAIDANLNQLLQSPNAGNKNRWTSKAAAGSFTTTEPHCGYCTFFLSVLCLPLTQPTRGRFNLANNNEYPIPARLKSSQEFVAQVCGVTPAQLLVEIKKLYLNDETADMDWNTFINNESGSRLSNLWQNILACLYDETISPSSSRSAPKKAKKAASRGAGKRRITKKVRGRRVRRVIRR